MCYKWLHVNHFPLGLSNLQFHTLDCAPKELVGIGEPHVAAWAVQPLADPLAMKPVSEDSCGAAGTLGQADLMHCTFPNNTGCSHGALGNRVFCFGT